jgi:hypothetical protein
MMSINSLLTDFLKDKVEPDTERDRIKEAHTEIREIVEDLLSDVLENSFVMGSYKRHTLVRRLSEDEKYDVDVFFVLNAEEDLEGLLDTMEAIAESIADQVEDIESYRRQKVSVGLLYKDNFNIDMVPGQLNDDGTYNIYDDREQKPVTTNPLKHIEVISALNIERGELLKPLIKLVKRWKQENAIKTMKSFHLEMLAVTVFENTNITNLTEGLKTFFNEAKQITENRIPIIDPVGGHDISGYLDSEEDPQRANAVDVLSVAAEALNDALKAEADSDSTLANRALGRIYSEFRNDEDESVSNAIGASLTESTAPRPWSE